MERNADNYCESLLKELYIVHYSNLGDLEKYFFPQTFVFCLTP